MKKISLILWACAAMLVSCGGGNNTNNTANTDSAVVETNDQQAAIVKLHKWSNDCPNITGLKITADSLYVTQDGKDFAYKIDRDKSCEKVEFEKYEWIFAVSKCNAQTPDYKQITVMSHLTEIYGEPDEYEEDLCCFDTKEDKERLFTHACEVDGIQGLDRQHFANYPVSKPMPELVFDTKMFSAYSITNAIPAPEIIANAKKISIKDSTITVDDGSKSVDLAIYPLSDNERVYSEGYEWIFITKPNGDIPRLQWEVNTSFPDSWNDIPEKERWVNLSIDKCGYYDVDFHSWKNLKRKMFINYPTDEEYQRTMEEGIYPDVEDDEDYDNDDEYLGDNPEQAHIELCQDLWNDLKNELKEEDDYVFFAHREEAKTHDGVVKIEGLSDKGATHYEANFYPLELGRDFKIYIVDHDDKGNYYVYAYQYGQLGFQEVPLEPILKESVEGINATNGPFHFDGDKFVLYEEGKLITELEFDYDKGEFVKK